MKTFKEILEEKRAVMGDGDLMFRSAVREYHGKTIISFKEICREIAFHYQDNAEIIGYVNRNEIFFTRENMGE
jgi:hypothetical protein